MIGARRQSRADAAAFTKRVDEKLQAQRLAKKQADNKAHNESFEKEEAKADSTRNTGRHHDDELNYYHNRKR